MASAIRAYNTVLSRRLRSLPCGAEVATDVVTDGVCGDAAGRLNAAARSAISESGSISSSCRTRSWYRRACFTAPVRSPAAARASMSFFVAPDESGSAFESLRNHTTLCEWSPASAARLARHSSPF